VGPIVGSVVAGNVGVTGGRRRPVRLRDAGLPLGDTGPKASPAECRTVADGSRPASIRPAIPGGAAGVVETVGTEPRVAEVGSTGAVPRGGRQPHPRGGGAGCPANHLPHRDLLPCLG